MGLALGLAFRATLRARIYCDRSWLNEVITSLLLSHFISDPDIFPVKNLKLSLRIAPWLRLRLDLLSSASEWVADSGYA